MIGRNGVGKSTLIATIMGHTVLHQGEILLAGRSLAGWPIHRRALAGLGLVPQEREIFPSRTVAENLEIAARQGPWTIARALRLFQRHRPRRRGPSCAGGERQADPPA